MIARRRHPHQRMRHGLAVHEQDARVAARGMRCVYTAGAYDATSLFAGSAGLSPVSVRPSTKPMPYISCSAVHGLVM